MAVRSLVLVAFLALGIHTMPIQANEAKDLAGEYNVRGTNGEGSKYTGTASIIHKGGNSVEIVWEIGKRKDIGLGRVQNGKLIVEYQGKFKTERGGKVTYDINPKRLVGKWKEGGGKGTENLIRK